ncbi:hypothetical protein [Limnothrix redekei]|uniref:DUF2157 domain-containing protein n=1 Tax=Limnothrix redekei LRLZ20PSL1 TaxID=3112953 RepID=A0ABW7CEK1_9CYAN
MADLAPQHRDHLLTIELAVRTSDPRLLEGLEVWLRLGLVSEDWVREVASTWLTCPLPATARSPVAPALSSTPQPATQSPGRLRAITAELSVVWLLLLGAFLVVVSSAWLAASFWSQVGGVGQYGILLLYTILFWGAALWTDRQARLRLTGQTLRALVTLLLPVNAWAADGLGLPLWGWFGAGALWLMIAWTMVSRRSVALLILLACGLHWNWSSGQAWAGVTICAGLIALAAAWPGRWQLRSRHHRALMAGSLLILLLRALATQIASLADVALVMVVSGLLVILDAREATRAKVGLNGFGWLLVGLGWLLGQTDATAPWQQLTLALIAGGLLWERLQRSGRRADLLGLTLVMAGACRGTAALLPDDWRSSLWVAAQSLLELRQPEQILGLLWLPYPIVPGGLAIAQQRRDRPDLAKFGLGLALGILLLLNAYALALWPHNLRLLPLSLLTTASFGLVASRSPLGSLLPQVLANCTLTAALAAVYALARFALPTTSAPIGWGQVGIGAALVLWSLVAIGGDRSPWQPWVKTSWWLGLGLAGLSLVQLTHGVWETVPAQVATSGLLSWLVIPLALLGLAAIGPGRFRKAAKGLGAGGLVLAQSLAISSPQSLTLSLGVAGLALGASSLLPGFRQGWVALMAVTFGWLSLSALTGAGVGSWSGLALGPWVTLQSGLLVVAWGLWWLGVGRSSPLLRLYGQALDRWATAVSWLLLSFTALRLLVLALDWDQPQALWEGWVIGLLLGAIGFRLLTSRRAGRPAAIPGLLWAGAAALELAAAETLRQLNGSLSHYAVVTLGLGFICLFATERLGRQFPSRRWLPLGYGLLTLLWRSNYWDGWTGLLMVGVALIGLRVAARSPHQRWLSYSSLAIASWGWGELAFFWTGHWLPAGTTTDALVLFAVVAGFLAWFYDLGRDRWGRSLFALNGRTLAWAAHGHWLVGTGFSGLLWLTAGPTHGPLAWAALGLLVAYPWVQGWRTSGLWVDLAALQTIAWISWGRAWLPGWAAFDPHWPVLAAFGAIGLAVLGQTRSPKNAWERVALWLPASMSLLLAGSIAPPALMVVAASYGALAALLRRRRLYYLGLLFATWSIWRSLWLAGSMEALLYVGPLGSSLILAAEIDPAWQGATGRPLRHGLRLAGTGIIAWAAFAQHSTDWVSLVLALGAIGAGIFWQVRAYLLMGSLLLGAATLANFVELNARWSFLKWLVGLALGTGMIWLAATFETQRDRAMALLQRWSDDLDRWD